MELSVDTSTRYASVGLSRKGELLLALSWHSAQNHTVELMPAILALLSRAGARPSDLTALVVARGPGGFSALRVGLGLVKGMAVGLGIPMVGVGTLEVEAFPLSNSGLPVCPLLDVGRGEVAWALYQADERGWRQLREESIASIEGLAVDVAEQAVFCGEGAVAHAEELRERLGQKALLVGAGMPTRSVAALAHLGHQRLSRGERDDVSTLQPLYLRSPSVSRPKSPAG
ncbi:MAG: tRNA (adenosine(37)-N6)-threonylcarbamoyltransferase complex dimerization subunit type 1 TsaB [Chloroflexi bacterium]|nr:tRNA (adenosine(37)-N6)-threonylcarbamoyltransferase complex dimerization subunit type 1 TsaB [Chloroflexota bacterium]